MRFIIRTTEYGVCLPLDTVIEKRQAAYKRILDAGFEYVESEATMGFRDVSGERKEEAVYIIEAVTGGVYV